MHPDLDLNFITTAVSLTASDQKIDFKIIGTLVSILLRSTALHSKNQCFDLKAHLKHTFDIQIGNRKSFDLMSFASFHWKEIHIFHNSFQCTFFLENRKGVKRRKRIQWIIFRSLCGDHLFSPIAYLIATFIQQTLTQTCVWVSKCIEHKSINCFDSSTSKIR